MAYSDNFPATRPVFMADFANGGKIDPRATFSRASTANVWDGSKHLSSENLVAQSSDLGSWSKGAVDYLSLTSNATTAPDGTTTAAQLTGLTGTNKKAIYFPVSAGSGSHTGIFFVKPNGHEYVQIMFGGVSTVYQNYHLSSTGTLGNGNNDGASITQMGDWYKITLTSSSLSSATNYYLVLVDNNTASRYQDSTSTSSVYAWGANLSSTGEKVFNATTTSIHRQYASSLVSKANNAARFEVGIDGQSAGTSLGILVEGQSTNLNDHSSSINSHAGVRLNVDQNVAIAPDGTLTADKVRVDTTGSASHYKYIDFSATSGQNYTVSFYVKKTEMQYAIIRFQADNSVFTTSNATFDLTNGTLGTVESGVTAKIESVGNNWYRIIATRQAAATATAFILFAISDTDNALNTANTGDNYSGLLVWGGQIEASSFASSLISTSGASATRAADSLSVATADIPGFSEGVGTIVCETGGVASATALNQTAFGLNGPASNNHIYAGVNAGGLTDSIVRVYSQTPDGDQAFLGPGTATVGTGYKLACRYGLDNFAASMNGGAVVSDTNGKAPVGIDTLWVGELDGNYHLNSNVKRIAIYNEALSDTNLQALTS